MRRCVAERVYDGLVTSTLYTALINVSLYAVASYLTGHPAQVLVVLTILSGTVSIYTLNRITDREEDRINDPWRSRACSTWHPLWCCSSSRCQCSS